MLINDANGANNRQFPEDLFTANKRETHTPFYCKGNSLQSVKRDQKRYVFSGDKGLCILFGGTERNQQSTYMFDLREDFAFFCTEYLYEIHVFRKVLNFHDSILLQRW